MLDPIQIRSIRQTLVFAVVVAALAGAVSPLIEEVPSLKSAFAAMSVGFFCTIAILTVEAQIKERLSGKLPLLGILALGILIDILLIFGIMLLAVAVFGLNEDGVNLHDVINRPDFIFGCLAMAVIILLMQFVLTIRTILGKGVLSRLLLGTFRTPREVERFFMFIDLRESTRIGEKLGHRRFLAFLNEFYRDLDRVAVFTRGEIHKYAGDGAVITWKPRGNARGRTGVDFFFQLAACLENRRDFYMRTFGELPRFKAGLHFGTAITAEMGHGKKEIALIGDVMNTAARLEQACKQVQETFLVSQAALDRLALPAGVRAHKDYKARLRGKEEAIRFHALSRA
jgi:adenylate cyclase